MFCVVGLPIGARGEGAVGVKNMNFKKSEVQC